MAELTPNFSEAPDPVKYEMSHNRISRIVRAIWRLNIVGREILPATGSYIYMPSHRSQLDPFIAGIIPVRAVYFMAKKEIWDNPLYSPLESYFQKRGAFPVDRKSQGDRLALSQSMKVIRDHHVLGIFAEGTSRNRGGIEDIKAGASSLAVWAANEGIDCPVVPVGLDSEKPWPFKGIDCVVREPMYPSMDGRKSEVKRRFRDELTVALRAVHHQAIEAGANRFFG